MSCCSGGWGLWANNDGALFALSGRNVERLDVVHAPGEARLRGAYARMTWLFPNLSCAPRLAFVQGLGGRGGIYADGLIVIGVEDAIDVAARIWRSDYSQVVRTLARPHHRTQEDLMVALVVEVMGRVIAHELGHAVRRTSRYRTPYQNEELAADFTAGWIERRTSKIGQLGCRIFHAIGCNEIPCTHPNSAARVCAYAWGWNSGAA